MRALLFSPLLVIVACADEPAPPPLVTCHNANCAYTDPVRDDTIPALRESLALAVDGRAMIDGIELDFLWDAAARRCVFEHDPVDIPTAADASEAAEIVAAHLRTHGRAAAWNGERFIAKLELKAMGGPDPGLLSPSDMLELEDCGLAVADTLERAARDAGLAPTTLFLSENPVLLLGLEGRPGWDPARSGRGRERQLALPPETDDPRLLADIGVIDAAYRHTRVGDVATYDRLRGDGIDLMITAFELTESALATLDYVAPAYINCNEAPIIRAWIDR